jgi:lysophospholipid acyltransferase (LPLAT)-like uncharacterized protein
MKKGVQFLAAIRGSSEVNGNSGFKQKIKGLQRRGNSVIGERGARLCPENCAKDVRTALPF